MIVILVLIKHHYWHENLNEQTICLATEEAILLENTNILKYPFRAFFVANIKFHEINSFAGRMSKHRPTKNVNNFLTDSIYCTFILGKGEVFYGQEPPSIESTTGCGFNYQLLAVMY